ncbi:hypothetical protein T492DRAFT_835526 [Pavlovales sp. CCMP2436]|nr:hypothetical protein T492DRAFT_835526 [Pavlovales sp. CCMP2436]
MAILLTVASLALGAAPSSATQRYIVDFAPMLIADPASLPADVRGLLGRHATRLANGSARLGHAGVHELMGVMQKTCNNFTEHRRYTALAEGFVAELDGEFKKARELRGWNFLVVQAGVLDELELALS